MLIDTIINHLDAIPADRTVIGIRLGSEAWATLEREAGGRLDDTLFGYPLKLDPKLQPARYEFEFLAGFV